MAIAIHLKTFLDTHHLDYEAIRHRRAESAQRKAAAADRPGARVAKAVLLKDDQGYLLAVLPASHRLHLGQLHRELDRRVGLATEEEATALFDDCRPGAVPPTGLLYDVDTLVEDALLEQPEVYFEAGDHEHLIHMDREAFGKLLGDATHGHFSHRL